MNIPPADGRCFASWAIEYAVNSTAIIAKSTASGVIPPANDVAAPIDSAVATAGAMWVIDWNSTSGKPMASRSSDGAASPLVARTRSSRPSSLPHGKVSPSSLCWGQAAAEY